MSLFDMIYDQEPGGWFDELVCWVVIAFIALTIYLLLYCTPRALCEGRSGVWLEESETCITQKQALELSRKLNGLEHWKNYGGYRRQ